MSKLQNDMIDNCVNWELFNIALEECNWDLYENDGKTERDMVEDAETFYANW